VKLKQTYSSREVAALTGLSARQLQLWDAGGLLSPAIPPHKTAAGGYTERRYTPIELFELFVLADLRQRGFTVADLHAIVNALSGVFGVRLFEATGGGQAVRLLSDGRAIFARTLRGDVYNLLESPSQPLLAIGDDKLLRELKGAGRAGRAGGAGRERRSGGSGGSGGSGRKRAI
jgi:hypothetical protein